jgi:hypothetical protein
MLAALLAWIAADASTIDAAWIAAIAVVLAAAVPSLVTARRVGPRHPKGSVTEQIERLENEAYYRDLLLHAIAHQVGIDPDRPDTWPTNRRRRAR